MLFFVEAKRIQGQISKWYHSLFAIRDDSDTIVKNPNSRKFCFDYKVHNRLTYYGRRPANRYSRRLAS